MQLKKVGSHFGKCYEVSNYKKNKKKYGKFS